MDHSYWVYATSRRGTLYIGITNSIARRMWEHKRGEIEGFAKPYHCDRLVYFESFDDVHQAIGREKQLKGWRCEKKIALIESKNLRWKDLAESGEHKWRLQARRSRVVKRTPRIAAAGIEKHGVLRRRYRSLRGR